ncbi:MAG: hypothetical protein ACI4TD_09265 [Phocaeicola sp.]
MVLSEDEYYKIRYSGYAMEDYAPNGVYNYKLDKSDILATLNADLLTSDLIPMLNDFFPIYK